MLCCEICLCLIVCILFIKLNMFLLKLFFKNVFLRKIDNYCICMKNI